MREKQRCRQREKQAPCRGPNVGLDPRTKPWAKGRCSMAEPPRHPEKYQVFKWRYQTLFTFLLSNFTQFCKSSLFYIRCQLLEMAINESLYIYITECYPSWPDDMKRFYLYDREHKQREQQRGGGGEAGSPLSREPEAGLDPRTLGSWPELKLSSA